jgi:lipoyl synthase
MDDVAAPRQPKPEWLRVRLPAGQRFTELKRMMRDRALHTVCEEARCPNIGECWNAGTATFMLLCDVCTRACGFCAVTTGRPLTIDPQEPLRVAQAVAQMRLRHAVVTSVNRDDLQNGGSQQFASTIRWIRRLSPGTSVEVLIPDFLGNWDALSTVLECQPEILNHNVETVSRLYRRVRPKARYERSLELLQRARTSAFGGFTKTGFMVGLGETRAELSQLMGDLRSIDCDILTIGQYLRPTSKHLELVRYYSPAEFDELAEEARSLGFRHVESGPLVRSSYHAERQVPRAPNSTLIPLENLLN